MSESTERILLFLDSCRPEQAYFREIARGCGLTYYNTRRYLLEFETRDIIVERLPPRGAHYRSRFFRLTRRGRVLASRPWARSFSYQGSGRWTRLNRTKVAILRRLQARSSAEVTRPLLSEQLEMGVAEIHTAVKDLEAAHLVRVRRTHYPYDLSLTPEGEEVAVACGAPLPLTFFPPPVVGGR